MTVGASPGWRYRVGDWIVDPQRNRIRSNDRERVLEPRLIDLLVFFCEHPGTTLTRDTLLEAVWGSPHFTDSAVSRAISVLRSSLGDEAREPRYLQTIPRRGYRLVAPVERIETELSTGIPATRAAAISAGGAGVSAAIDVEAPGAGAADGPADTDRQHKAIRGRSGTGLALPLLGILLAVLGLSYFGWSRFGSEAGHGANPTVASIAVLPFQKTAFSSGDTYLADGLHQEIAMHLARTSAPTIYLLDDDGAGETATSEQALARTGAEAKLLGRVEVRDDAVEVLLSLEDVRTGRLLWTELFDGEAGDLLGLRNRILGRLDQRIGRQDGADPQAGQIRTSEAAYRLYLKAGWHWRQRTAEHLREARRLYQQTIEVDPGFAQAYAGLALCELMMVNYVLIDAQTGYRDAQQWVSRALELDPTDAQGLTADAQLRLQRDWDFRGALERLDIVIGRHPDLTDPLQYKAEILSVLGRHEQAMQVIDRAVSLKPYSALLVGVQGMIHTAAGDYAGAERIFVELESLHPGFFWHYRYWSYARLARGDVSGAWDVRLRRFRYTMSEDDYAAFRQRMGELPGEKFWIWQIERLKTEYPEPSAIAAVLMAEAEAALDHPDEAMQWIGIAVSKRGEAFPVARISPYFDALREREDYRRLMAANGLSD